MAGQDDDSIDDKFDKPVFAPPGSLDDLSSLPGEFRSFRIEMRDSLAGIARALQTLGRIEERLDVVIDRQNVLEANHRELVAKVEQDMVAAARERKRLSERIDALELPAKPIRASRRK